MRPHITDKEQSLQRAEHEPPSTPTTIDSEKLLVRLRYRSFSLPRIAVKHNARGAIWCLFFQLNHFLVLSRAILRVEMFCTGTNINPEL